VAGIREHVNGTFKEVVAPASELASVGIIDEERVLVGQDRPRPLLHYKFPGGVY
jgi:hypothetical protein